MLVDRLVNILNDHTLSAHNALVLIRSAIEARRAHPEESLWKGRFEMLLSRLEDIEFEVREAKMFEPMSEYPISSSHELFISYNWDVVDSRSRAVELWGEGKFERWVREPKT